MDIDEVAKRLAEYPDPKKAVDQIDIPYSVLQTGTGRVVTKHPENNTVLKFAVGHGIKQNRSEIRVSELSESRNFQSDIATVIESQSDGYWLEMEKVRCPDGMGYGKVIGPNSQSIYDKLESSGVIMYEIETGYIGENPVAYDYGTIVDIRD